MGHVQKFTGQPRKDGSVAMKWRAAGKDVTGKRVSKVFDRKADAQAWLREVESARVVGSAHKTLLDVAEAHYKHFDSLVKAGAREAVTRDSYATAIERHLKADKAFCAVKLADLATPRVQAFLDDLFVRTGSLDLTRRMRRVLVTWCDFAVRKGDLVMNPASPCKVESTARPDEGEEQVDIPSKDVLASLLRAAGEGDHPERDTAAVHILLFGGLRISEMLGLADDAATVAKAGGELRIRERLDRHYEIIGKVKTKRARRDIPIGPAASSAVKAWRLRRGPSPAFMHNGHGADRSMKPGRLFPHPDGRSVWGYLDFMRQCWLPMMRRAGLVTMEPDTKGKNRPVQAFGPHTLRHAAVSLWIAQGLSPKRVQELAGHSSLQMTMDLYGHLWRDAEGDADLAKRSEAMLLGRNT